MEKACYRAAHQLIIVGLNFLCVRQDWKTSLGCGQPNGLVVQSLLCTQQ